MPYRIAGIDVHKKMLAVVVSDVEIDGGSSSSDEDLAATLNSCGRSRAQYWRPVWEALERSAMAPMGHKRVRYEERGPAVSKRSKQLRSWKTIRRQLRRLGYQIEPRNPVQHKRSDFRPWQTGVPGFGTYSATKTALVSFVRI